MKTIALMSVLLSCYAFPVNAQQDSLFDGIAPTLSKVTTATSPNRHLVVICGLPGDDAHRDRMTEACSRIIQSAETVIGVSADRMNVLVGDEQMQADLGSVHDDVQLCSRESIEAVLSQAATSLSPTDAFWLIAIGHSHPYGAESQLNIAGKDVNQAEFGKWASGIECGEQVFWLSQPISGFWIKPLARPGRVVVTATEADLEFTATEMPYALADVLAGESENQELDDIDGDGSVSLLDLYLATNLEITGRFAAIDRLQTEHAQLDDNGDGRGSEVQEPYLPIEPDEEEEEDSEEDEEPETEDEPQIQEEVAETLPKPPLIQSRNRDGFRSRYILIEKPRKLDGETEGDVTEPEPEN